ncbi:uncharacterized protein BDW70DRAFT_149035 [Aspergillus foveolatus]|uniref:uncharacterized protein n=1 Tax=Aspergillus foveolatus TaxID=210207 RepID=UPI003CCD7FDD
MSSTCNHFTLGVSFSHYGSLYYKEDVHPPASNHFVKEGKLVRDSAFAIGPATGRDWNDAGRLGLHVEKGPLWPCVWHNDLHDDNVFVDPQNPEKITGIIDWQSCHISSLFNHSPDPAFLDWDGLEPETLDLAPRPSLSGLSPEERRGSHRMFEYGEAHFLSLLIDLKDTWANLPAVTSDTPFPFDFSDADIERIKLDSNGAVAATKLIAGVKERMGGLWPDKGFIEHERYDDCEIALREVKGMILEQLAETDVEKAEYERYWPFD